MPILQLQPQSLIGIAQAFFALVLAVITYYYWKETKRQTDEMNQSREVTREQTEEMEKNREADFRPVVRANLENYAALEWKLAIKNTGKGTAYNLTAEWGFKETSENHWERPVFSPEEESSFLLNLDDERLTSEDDFVAALSEEERKLKITFQYEDALNNELIHEDSLDIVQLVTQGREPGFQDDNPEAEYYELQRQVLKHELREITLETLEEHGQLDFGSLVHLTGINGYQMRHVLLSFEEANIVEVSSTSSSDLTFADGAVIELR